ncbi:hypothetical protein K450DRAFT_249200 [Umbelopsis ramanniana AG]|uniref:Stress response protein NST1 n=1 Tax=Umbelopsis ramanniana AG TaxID=1314678 RepID=A0AAD5E775_UMBRA|nr:uncharacterized protein K450DRAFT_249200 [Umbelopsis ramanniana AG]KAI8577954.1 hypothetical protein K450DRAFT_249200 [Umbelopsis ramanniana AG]
MAKEAQRLAEEEKARIEKERKLEEERHKREQERLKKEEERRQREEERLRKEEEKRRRMKEEKDRLMEKERKRKEKEEKERKEREEKERKEAEVLMRKEVEQKERLKDLMKERQEQNRKDSSTIPSSIPPSLSNFIPTASQSTPSNHSSMPYVIKSGSTLRSPKALYSDVDESSPSLDTTLSLTPLAISNAPQPLSFHHPLPSSPLSPVRSPSFRNHLPTSSLPVNTVFQDQEMEKSSTGVNSLANHSMGVLPVGYPKRMSSQLETAPVKPITRSSIAPIGKPPGYRRKSASMGVVGGPTIGAERRAQPPFETMVEPPFTEALQVDSSTQDAVNESHSSPSFFSLFGDSKGSDAASSLLNGVADSPRQRSVPQRPWLMHSPQRSQSISGEGGNSAWPNISGWGTPSNLIDETVQSKLFGDVMPDRLQLIVERAKAAYLKLEELYTPTGHFPLNHWPVGMTFHPLFQLHRMYSDLFPDIVVDQQELLEACLMTNSGFNCINHPHQGYLLRYEMGDYNRRASLGVNGFLPSGPLSPSISGSTDINFHQFASHASPTGAQHHPPIPQPSHFLPSQQPPQPQQQLGQGNAALFGGLSL